MNSRFFAYLSGLAALNALLPAALFSIYNQGLLSALLEGFGRSPVIWLSLLIAVLLYRKAPQFQTAQTRPKKNGQQTHFQTDSIPGVCLAGFLTLALLIPIALLSWLICALSAFFWLRNSVNRYMMAAAWLMLSIAIREPLTQLMLNGFADQILGFDTWLSALFLPPGDQYSVSGNLINQDNGFSLLILTGCSAFTNLSLALLLWLSISLWNHQRLNMADLLRAGILSIIVLIINGVRLALMATGPDLYAYIHDGDGMLIVDALLFIMPVICVRPANKTSPQNSPAADNQKATSKLQRLNSSAMACLLVALVIAPAIRVTDIAPAITETDSVPVRGLKNLPISKLGELSPANRGNYRVSGFSHNYCNGSIALLPLQRNAEGAHILENMLDSPLSNSSEQITQGIIFAGQLYPEYPELKILIKRIHFQFSSVLSTVSQLADPTHLPSLSQNTFPQPMAFIEFGQCHIAASIAGNFPDQQRLSHFSY